MTQSTRRHLVIAPHPEAGAIVREFDEDLLLQVGELAKATGKTVRAIHLYESMGLIEPVRRSKGRYRLFAPDAKVRVRWISKLQSLGLSLSDIQDIVEKRQASESARLAAQELRDVYETKLQEVRDKIREYRALEVELSASVEFLQACQHACTDELTCAHCTHHHDVSEGAPELVAGARVEPLLGRTI